MAHAVQASQEEQCLLLMHGIPGDLPASKVPARLPRAHQQALQTCITWRPLLGKPRHMHLLFPTPQAAHAAFKGLPGTFEKDIMGRMQKVGQPIKGQAGMKWALWHDVCWGPPHADFVLRASPLHSAPGLQKASSLQKVLHVRPSVCCLSLKPSVVQGCTGAMHGKLNLISYDYGCMTAHVLDVSSQVVSLIKGPAVKIREMTADQGCVYGRDVHSRPPRTLKRKPKRCKPT